MLGYFPTLERGELLYSAIARFSAHTGVKSVPRINEILTGRSIDHSLAYNFPVRLRYFTERLAQEEGISTERIIQDHTLFPYYASTVGHDLASRLRRAMEDGGRTSFMGMVGRKMPRPDFLRFCPACVAAKESAGKEGYWRRDHQLESTLICIEHDSDLLPSAVPTTYAPQY